MVEWGDVMNSISSGNLGFGTIMLGVGIILVLLIVCAFGIYYMFFMRKWNLKAEIKLTRSGGHLTTAEWGKAYFDAKKGVCFIKRKGSSPAAVKIFDIRKYIQGDNIVTFIQVTPDDYRPVLNTSWEEYEEDEPMKDKYGKLMLDEKGNKIFEKASIMNIKIDPGLNKAWKAAWTQAAKQAYSLKSFMTQFQTPIAIAIVIIAVFVGFTMVWTRLGTICG